MPLLSFQGFIDQFSRNRFVALPKKLGLQGLIASDAGDYVLLAIKLAHDVAFKARMRADVAAHSDKLFHRTDVVRELESVFIGAHEASRRKIATGAPVGC